MGKRSHDSRVSLRAGREKQVQNELHLSMHVRRLFWRFEGCLRFCEAQTCGQAGVKTLPAASNVNKLIQLLMGTPSNMPHISVIMIEYASAVLKLLTENPKGGVDSHWIWVLRVISQWGSVKSRALQRYFIVKTKETIELIVEVVRKYTSCLPDNEIDKDHSELLFVLIGALTTVLQQSLDTSAALTSQLITDRKLIKFLCQIIYDATVHCFEKQSKEVAKDHEDKVFWRKLKTLESYCRVVVLCCWPIAAWSKPTLPQDFSDVIQGWHQATSIPQWHAQCCLFDMYLSAVHSCLRSSDKFDRSNGASVMLKIFHLMKNIESVQNSEGSRQRIHISLVFWARILELGQADCKEVLETEMMHFKDSISLIKEDNAMREECLIGILLVLEIMPQCGESLVMDCFPYFLESDKFEAVSTDFWNAVISWATSLHRKPWICELLKATLNITHNSQVLVTPRMQQQVFLMGGSTSIGELAQVTDSIVNLSQCCHKILAEPPSLISLQKATGILSLVLCFAVGAKDKMNITPILAETLKALQTIYSHDEFTQSTIDQLNRIIIPSIMVLATSSYTGTTFRTREVHLDTIEGDNSKSLINIENEAAIQTIFRMTKDFIGIRGLDIPNKDLFRSCIRTLTDKCHVTKRIRLSLTRSRIQHKKHPKLSLQLVQGPIVIATTIAELSNIPQLPPPKKFPKWLKRVNCPLNSGITVVKRWRSRQLGDSTDKDIWTEVIGVVDLLVKTGNELLRLKSHLQLIEKSEELEDEAIVVIKHLHSIVLALSLHPECASGSFVQAWHSNMLLRYCKFVNEVEHAIAEWLLENKHNTKIVSCCSRLLNQWMVCMVNNIKRIHVASRFRPFLATLEKIELILHKPLISVL